MPACASRARWPTSWAEERTIRILIVTYAFPPQNVIASHRPYSWAKAWRDLGHEIVVLTFAKHVFDGALDLERDTAGMQVHEVPYLPARQGGARQPTRTAAWERLKTLTRRLRFGMGIFGDPRTLAYFPLVRHGMRLAAERPFDLIVATSPPEIDFMVARTLARRTGTPWVADFRDLWFSDMLLHRSPVAAWFYGRLNRWLVASASALSTVSRGLQDRLSAFLGREVVVSYNGFFDEEHPLEPSVFRDGRRHIIYTGRLYPGKRDPQPLFRALASLKAEIPDIAERVVVDFYGFDDPWLRGLVARYHLGNCVRLHGFVPYRQSIALQRAADVLLFLDWMDAGADGILTGKLLEYLGSRRPILALAPRQDTEAAQLIATAGAGRALCTEAEIVRYIRDLISSTRPADVPAERAARYSRVRQAVALLEAMQERLNLHRFQD